MSPEPALPQYFVFLHGYASRDENLAREFSTATGMSQIDAKMILGLRFPKHITSFHTGEEGKDYITNLRAHGFDGFIMHKSVLTRPPSIVQARNAELKNDRVIWSPIEVMGEPSDHLGILGERTLEQDLKHARMIFLGQFRSFTKTESTEDRGRGYMGGRITRTHTSRTRDEESFLLVLGDDMHSFLLVRERSFNYACLGKDRGYVAAVNLRTLVDRLRGVFPQARFDDSLLQDVGEADLDFHGKAGSSSQAFTGLRLFQESNEIAVLQMARILAILGGLH